MDSSLKFYETNAQTYFDRVHSWDMSTLYSLFHKHFAGNTILDLGCGTGRDARYFADMGWRVIAVDGSKAMLAFTRRECPAADCRLVDYSHPFSVGEPIDAIWACASLLHLDDATFETTLSTVVKDLRVGGLVYLGLKQSELGAPPQDGRFFNYWTPERLAPVFGRCQLAPVEQVVDATPRITWLNSFLQKQC